MSNTNIEDVMVQLTETRNELSEEDLRLWDGLENERVSRIAGDDANKSLTLQVQDSVSGTERRLSTEVIHREQGDLDKLGLLNQLSQSMSAYRIKTDKEIEAERFARDILGINLDARITTAEASFNHKELKLYQDIQEVFTDLDGKYISMDTRIKKYEEMLQDITMDSIKITMDNGEINMGAWTILSQAREWDLEILAKMRGFQEKTNEDVNQALEELQNQLPITENIINELMENLSESPLISELRDALNESIDTSESLAVRLAKEEAARAQAMIDLAYANAQALAAEKAALAESLAAEAQARADEVQEEADRRIESIRQIRADLAQDVGELNDHVDSIRDGAAADKAGILETVNNYKTELKSDIATVNTELLGALDGVNTLVTEVRDENGVTLNELTTYKASNDVALAGVLSKVTTNISDTAANASKITGLTTQLATTNTELGTVRNTSAIALSKANTAVTANSALATRVDSLAAAITDLGEGAETTVDVYAFNALKAEVQTNAAGVTSLVEQVDALGTSYTDLADGVEANTDAVSTLTVKQSEMNGDISQLSSDVTYLTSELGVTNTALNTKASNQALSNLNTKLTTTDGKVAANTQQLTQLNTDLTTVRDGLETKASTEALNDLATEVVELEDGLAVNASAITSLKSEIDTELDKKATVTAVNGLTTKVEEVEGKTTTNANNLLALNTSVGNVVKGLANKLDASAISDYYTKSQTDDKASEVAAGKVEEFNASLVIGGSNLYTGTNPIKLSNYAGSYAPSTAQDTTTISSSFDANTIDISALKHGDPVCVSMEFMIPSTSVGDFEWILSAYRLTNASATSGGGYKDSNRLKSQDCVKDKWYRIDLLQGYYPTTAASERASLLRVVLYKMPVGAQIEWRNLMIEKATKHSPYVSSDKTVQSKIDANSTAIQNTDAEVSRVDGRVTATNSAQTLLEGRVQTVEGDITKKADASALSSLDTRVGTVEGQYTTQASDITKLSNSLDTTNVNVGTAQTAAQNAMNAAGAKGKVIFGSSAPAVADRLIQNLWIDTTSNANTPKRWNGSAWVVVTDKVAIDAAKAVSDLDTVVKTKADVSALNSLTTKVTDDAKKTTANTNSITTLNSDIVKINNNLATKANASALSDMYTKNEVDDKAAEIAAGEISKYDASLVIGGTNLVTKSYKNFGIGSSARPELIREILEDGSLKVTSNNLTSNSYVAYWVGASSSMQAMFDELVVDNPFTVTLWFKAVDPENLPTSEPTLYFGGGLNYLSLNADLTQLASGKEVAYTYTRIWPGITSSIPHLSFSPEALGGGLILTKWKVEKGSKSTDWTESPQDIQNQFDATATAIQNTNVEVGRVDGKTTVNANAITGLASRMGTVEGQVSTKAEASALQDYYTKTESEANATTVAAGEVAKYDASLVIGGANLYTGPNPVVLRSQTAPGRIDFTTAGSGNLQRFNYLTAENFDISSLKKDDPTIASIEVYIPSTTTSDYTIQFGTYRFSATGYRYAPTIDIKDIPKDTWVKLEAEPGSWPATVTETGVNLVFNLNGTRVAGDRFMWRNFMMEKASKASAFSESDKAVQTKLDANATAIENTNAEVGKVDGRVTTESNRITTLTGRVSTAEKGLALKADVAALNDIYTKTESDAKATSLAAGEISKYDASLVIGGSNLIVESNKFLAGGGGSGITKQVLPNGSLKLTGAGSTYHTFTTSATQLSDTSALNVGDDITVTLWVKAVDTTKLPTRMPQLYLAGPHPTYLDNFTAIGDLSKGGLVRYVQTRKVSRASSYLGNAHMHLNAGTLGGGLIIEKWQLEAGSKGTDWKPSNSEVQQSIDANASAISTTNSEVSRINDVVKGHVTDIRNLTTSIAGKADSSALNELTVRVENEEGRSSTQASEITSLTSKADDLLDSVTIKDTRSTNQPPSWYWANYTRRSVNEFKSQTAIGVSGFFGGTYCNLETRVYYSDSSGGGIIQTATSSNDTSAYVQRTSTGSGTSAVWTAWSQPIKDIRDELGTKASASAVSSLTTKVNDIDGLVTSQAEQITTLTSDNSDNKNALQVQAKVVDGVKASYMVKMESNGVIGGFGMIQNTGNMGQVVTSFGVNADAFFIGAPVSKKQPFIVTTTNQVVNGVTYPAGTYIDVALIANATIGTAKIADLAVTNAKIVDATIESAKIKSIKADKIEVGNPLVGPITSAMVTGTSLANKANLFTNNIAANAPFATYGTGTRSATSGAESSYIQIDVGTTVTMPEVRFFFRGSAGRITYIKLKASVDGVNWDYIMGSASRWETINDMPPGPGSDYSTVTIQASFSWYGVKPYRYLRLYGNGSSASTTNELVAIIGNASGSVTKIGSEGILTNSITADKLSASAIETISLSARNGTFTAADGSKTVINGGLTTVYDSAGKLRMRLGVW